MQGSIILWLSYSIFIHWVPITKLQLQIPVFPGWHKWLMNDAKAEVSKHKLGKVVAEGY